MRYVVQYCMLFALAVAVATPVQAKGTFRKSKGQEIHYREASSYAHIADKRDIFIGTEFLSKPEQKRLLGHESGKYAVLEVAITNNSRFRLYVNGINFVNADGGNAVSAIALDAVARAIGPSGSGNKKGLQLSILRNNLSEKSLLSRVVIPGETIQGLVFMDAKLSRKKDAQLNIDIQNLKRLVYLDIQVPVSK